MATQTSGNLTDAPSRPANGHSEREKTTAGTSSKLRTLMEKITVLATKNNPWAAFKLHRERRKQEIPKKKVPSALRFWRLYLLLASEILILLAITVLWILTETRRGFVDVPDTPSTIEDTKGIHQTLLWAYALLWTFLPAFIVSTCGKLFSLALDALEVCQPTIELGKYANQKSGVPQNSTAKKTILLDYGSEWLPFRDTFHAFQNRHFLIGVCMLVKWLFVATGPLSASIISIANVPSTTNVEVISSTFFDDWKNESSTRPAFESASAILLNNGSPYPWTTEISSVVPFDTASTKLGNLTANTRAYSASLDCVPIDMNALLSAGNVTLENANGGNTTNFYFTDRGCSMNTWMGVSPSPPLFSQTRFLSCPLDTDEGRLVFMTGVYDPSSSYLLIDFSLISCVPYFWNSTAIVSVLSSPTMGGSSQITGIIPNVSSITRFWPEFWGGWMQTIPEYRIEDPTLPSDSDDFGKLAYDYAKRVNQTAPDFIQAMNTTFSVLFAAFATTSTYSPRTQNLTFTGTLARPANRLFVVFFPAVIVTIVMSFSLLVTIWIAIYASRYKVQLRQHLDLILGHAILLEKNEGVNTFIAEAREKMQMQASNEAAEITQKKSKRNVRMDAAKYGDLVEYAGKIRELTEWECWIDNGGKLKMESGRDNSNSA